MKDASHTRVINDNALAALVRRAHRRQILQVLVDETSLAIAIFFGGSILLLLLGTQVLDWYWLVALCVAALGFGGYRARKRLLSEYAVARKLDHNLELHDALSTAFYFQEHPEAAHTEPEVIERQRDMAVDLARTADVRLGWPLAFSRSVYVSGMLALAAVSVFGLRYGVTHTLDLRPSLVKIAFEGVFGQNTRIADARTKKPEEQRPKDWRNPSTLKYDPWEAQTMDQKGAPDSALNTVDTPNVDNSNNTGPSADPKTNSGKESNNTPDSMADNPDGEKSSGKPDQSPEGSQAPSKDGSKAGNPPPNSDQKGNNAESSSLSDKMRDALANLLSKLKMQPKGAGNKSGGQQQNQNGGQQSAQNRQNQNGTPTPGKPQADASSQEGQQANQDSQGAEQAKTGQGKSNGKSEERSSSQDGKSGIGKQDGDKSIKEAEQLAAMGKISEIIGKRAQNVSGEVMVEVASGSQQLRTQYSQRKAAHADTGGEINRDEVPLAYQQYVQSYFEEIRKLPPSAPAKAK